MSDELPALSDKEVFGVLNITPAPGIFSMEITESMRTFAAQIHQHVSTLNLEGSLAALDELIEFVKTMSIADHFSATEKAGAHILSAEGDHTVRNPFVRNRTEAEHKREQLLRDLESLKSQILLTIRNVRAVVADVLVTHMGFDNSDVVESNPDEKPSA